MNYIEAMKAIKTKEIPPVILIYGEEQFLIESAINQISDRIFNKGDAEDTLIQYDLEETTIDDVIMEAETYPFFSEQKIVIAKKAFFLTAKQTKSQVEHDLNRLIEYIEQPVDFSTLIIVVPYEKLDERKKVTKQLKKQAMTINCQEVKSWEIDQWLTHLAKQYQIYLDKSAEQILLNETGTNLGLLQSEIEKLALYVGENGQVTAEIARDLVSHQGQATGLNLVDMVISKDLTGAIKIYRDLMKLNEEPIALIGLLASQLRTIYQVKILRQKGYHQQQMARELKVHAYVVKMSLERERKFSLDMLYRCLTACSEIDQAIKIGKMEKELAFESLLYQLIST